MRRLVRTAAAARLSGFQFECHGLVNWFLRIGPVLQLSRITWRRFIAPITPQEDFHKYRIFTVHITALVALTLVLSHFWFRALPWIFTLYLIWSPWHYSGQNYGLFMMFARRGGANPSACGSASLVFGLSDFLSDFTSEFFDRPFE